MGGRIEPDWRFDGIENLIWRGFAIVIIDILSKLMF